MTDFVASLVIDKLVSTLTEDAKLLRGVHKEVAEIKDELKIIRAFLKDANARAEKECIDEGAKEWVNQVREAAYQIEDVIDEYILQAAQHPHLHGWKSLMYRISSYIKRLKAHHEIASEIEDIKISLRHIKERGQRYKFDSLDQRALSSNARGAISHDPRVGSLFIKEAELVGIESVRDELVDRLLEGASQRIVISVVGMGGAGKTTLAKKVYENQAVMAHFDCHAWITVSHSYEKTELLRSIMEKFYEARKEPFPQKIATMNYVIREVREYLQQKSYLVAFDDVWEVGFWEDVEHALLDNHKGSRVLITTRNKDVANFCGKSSLVHFHQMELLPRDKAWELFCQKAFQFYFDGHCPEELKELSMDIFERCGGLPLAIVAIGGLLATKEKVSQEWQKLRDGLGSALMGDPHLENITRILSLSYSDLPYHLKPCFLYFGMLPEDYSISYTRLIRLWIAAGFIKEKRGITLEEVAEEYLSELVHRSLVQVGRLNRKGKPKTCHIHDLIHDVIRSKSEDLNFSQASKSFADFEGVARHLTISNMVYNSSKSNTKSQTPSLMFCGVEELPKPLIRSIFSSFKLLKSLDFEKAPLDCIPEQLGNLLHLRFLSLRRTSVKIIPKSIGKLYNLETLDLRESLVYKLPVDISRFPKLRHLVAYSIVDYTFPAGINSFRGLKIQGNIGCLEVLQTLYSIELDGMGLISEFGRLKQLRKLRIKKLKKEHGMALCTALENMNNLRSLGISSRCEEELLDLHSISAPLLQNIGLKGRLERLPDWLPKLNGLLKLRLYCSRLTDDPLKMIQALPNLVHIYFELAYDGKQLHFREGGFQKLRVLRLLSLNALNTLVIENGALPLLEDLRIGPCPLLKEVPSGIQYLKNLKSLCFFQMPKEFARRMLPDGGQDYWIVRHIPFVVFRYVRAQRFRQYTTYKLKSPELVEYLRS